MVLGMLGMFICWSGFFRAGEKPGTQEQSISPFSYDLPAYVAPRKRWDVSYQVSVDKKGAVTVNIGNNSFPFSSYFSFPHGGWNAFSSEDEKTREPDWRVVVTGTGGEYRIEGEGKFYRVTRLIKLKADRIDVFDTISNKSKKEELGIIIKDQIYLRGIKIDKLFWAGNEVLAGVSD